MHKPALFKCALVALCLATMLGAARADTTDDKKAADGATASTETKTEAKADASLDFDLFSDQPKPDPAKQAADAARIAKIESQVRVRRKVLLAHQAIGFTTLAVMAATVILGQVNYVARYGGFNNGNDFERYQNAHLGLSVSTSALFTTLGILGLAAPNPYPKPIKADAALVHKVSMALATAGMVTQLILGPITAISGGRLDQRDMALGHVITGYATFGFMSAGVLAYVF